MGFKFRKKIKIAPGISLNLTQKGVSSASIGGRGVTLNVGGKKGAKITASLPNTGLSYTQSLSSDTPSSNTSTQNNHDLQNNDKPVSKVGIIIIIVVILMVLFALSGCSTVGQQSQTTISNNESKYNCSYTTEHYRQDGTYIAEAYNCYADVPQDFVSENGCSYVEGYYKNDGVFISSHQRCATLRSPTKLSPSSGLSSFFGLGQSSAPCVTGYCGSVHVKGYTRKDGTYVRPYTRSRRK